MHTTSGPSVDRDSAVVGDGPAEGDRAVDELADAVSALVRTWRIAGRT